VYEGQALFLRSARVFHPADMKAPTDSCQLPRPDFAECASPKHVGRSGEDTAPDIELLGSHGCVRQIWFGEHSILLHPALPGAGTSDPRNSPTWSDFFIKS
jgi:hypothetical protein